MTISKKQMKSSRFSCRVWKRAPNKKSKMVFQNAVVKSHFLPDEPFLVPVLTSFVYFHSSYGDFIIFGQDLAHLASFGFLLFFDHFLTYLPYCYYFWSAVNLILLLSLVNLCRDHVGLAWSEFGVGGNGCHAPWLQVATDREGCVPGLWERPCRINIIQFLFLLLLPVGSSRPVSGRAQGGVRGGDDGALSRSSASIL